MKNSKVIQGVIKEVATMRSVSVVDGIGIISSSGAGLLQTKLGGFILTKAGGQIEVK